MGGVALAIVFGLMVQSPRAGAASNQATSPDVSASASSQAGPNATCPVPQESIVDASLVVANGIATSRFSIAPGCSGVAVSLATYEAKDSIFAFPQSLSDSATGLFDAGGPYTLTAHVPACLYQVDLVRGSVIVTLTPEDLYGDRKIAFENGGAACASSTPPPSNSTAPAPPSTVDVSISKVADKAAVKVGAHVKYTITVTNNGPGAAGDVIVAEDLPAGMTLVSAVPSIGACDGQTPVICSLGSLAAGGSAVIEVEVTANSPGIKVNTAVVTTSSPDTNTANNTAKATVGVTPGVFTPPTVCRVLTLVHRTLLSTKPGIVEVRVKDTAGRPIANARVRAKGAGVAMVRTTSRNGVARFSVTPRSAGVIELTLLQSGSCHRQTAVFQVRAAAAAVQPSFTG